MTRKIQSYIILEEKTVVELMCKTGLERKELEQLLEDATNTESRVVFYRFFLKWYSVRVTKHVHVEDALELVGLETT